MVSHLTCDDLHLLLVHQLCDGYLCQTLCTCMCARLRACVMSVCVRVHACVHDHACACMRRAWVRVCAYACVCVRACVRACSLSLSLSLSLNSDHQWKTRHESNENGFIGHIDTMINVHTNKAQERTGCAVHFLTRQLASLKKMLSMKPVIQGQSMENSDKYIRIHIMKIISLINLIPNYGGVMAAAEIKNNQIIWKQSPTKERWRKKVS